MVSGRRPPLPSAKAGSDVTVTVSDARLSLSLAPSNVQSQRLESVNSANTCSDVCEVQEQPSVVLSEVKSDVLADSLNSCPRLNHIIQQCWQSREYKRPTADHVYQQLTQLLKQLSEA